jgi:aminopeptidase N
MQKCLFFLFLIFFTVVLYAQSNIDVLHYKFEIELSDNSDTIKGKATVQVKFLNASDNLTLNLVSVRQNGKGMWVDRVLENNNPVNFTQTPDSLNLKFSAAKQGDVRSFIIIYEGIPADGLIISKNKYGDRTFFADNWPNRAHNWIPCVDDPSDKASFEFIIIAPSKYRVVSNGMLEEETYLPDNKKLTHWKEDIALPTKVMVIGVAKFTVKKDEDSPQEIPVTSWVYPNDSTKGFRNYSPAPSILKFYSGYIGPYPYKKLANVQSKTIFGGMENASAIFYYEGSASTDVSVEDLLAHEIAHQWFGDMATEKSFFHLWLSEGFATYMTDIYLESKYGTDSMNHRLEQERKVAIDFAKHSSNPIVDSVSSLMELLNPNSYQKGAWVLHMLRRQMGDSVFRNFIRTYYDRFEGKNADTDDLESVAEEITHLDLKQFFKQWLYTPGIPQLDIKWKYVPEHKKIEITVVQQQKQTIYKLPLQVKMILASGKTIMQTLEISKQTEIMSFPINEPVKGFVADPNTSLLFEGRWKK